jgi:hypothetical protein
MALILPGNVASATAATGYDVANSCRFNDGDSPVLSRTLSDSEGKKFSFSVWLKRSKISYANCGIFGAYSSGSDYDAIYFGSDDKLDWFFYGGTGTMGQLKTNRVFRDVGAWYHILCVYDSANTTAGNRMRMYINGVEETDFATDTNPGVNTENNFNNNLLHVIGEFGNTGDNVHFGGYMSEVVFLDNVAASPTDFGEFDADSPTIWKPIDVSGLTFGTNGFYLDFEDSGTLGNDANGGTDWTATNLAATDQMTDTPTLNYSTIGTLFMGLNTPTFSEGNLQSYSSAAGISPIPSSMGLSTGKWYAELKYAATTSNDNTGCGITMDPASGNQANSDQGGYVFGYAANGNYFPYQGDPSGSGATYTVGDIIGIYMDLDNMKLYFSKNGTLNSSTGSTINVSNTGFYYFCVLDYTGSANYWTWQWNFGAGCPFTISSAVADANGYGAFEYDPSAGTFDGASKDFYALNTKNLAEFG